MGSREPYQLGRLCAVSGNLVYFSFFHIASIQLLKKISKISNWTQKNTGMHLEYRGQAYVCAVILPQVQDIGIDIVVTIHGLVSFIKVQPALQSLFLTQSNLVQSSSVKYGTRMANFSCKVSINAFQENPQQAYSSSKCRQNISIHL